MNLSTAIFLVNKGVHSVRVSYDPDIPKHNNIDKLYKTLDETLKKGDYVVVPTSTRHGFTVCKIEEVDFVVNFDTTIQFEWIVGKVDKDAYDAIVAQEKIVLDRVAKAEENRKRKELAEALGLADVNLTDLDIVKSNIQLAAPATPRGGTAPTPETAEPS
ncbi:MAG: hypothetical protein ACYDD1_04910 [Caulobacteraceae bacterium]